jgi:cyclopropane fatty-acyl-phospholipid synthase-like methyltransferase
MAGTEKVFDRYRSAGFGDTDARAADEGYRFYLPWLPADRGARILDLGCGGGEFLAFLDGQGYRAASGVDFSAEQVERCRARGLERVEVVRDTRAFLRGRGRVFERVVMNDVLEHVPKAECIALLEDIRASLVEGGSCIIKVPNASSAFGLVARYLDFTHEVAFTETSLKQVLVAAGFHDVVVAGLPIALKLHPKRLAWWLANRLYQAAHRAVYVAAVGSDAPTILTKLIAAHAIA